LLQVYLPNFEREYEYFLEKVEGVLYEVSNTEFIILLRDFSARFGADPEKWNNVTGTNSPSDLNNDSMKLLRFHADSRLSIINTFLEHRTVHQYKLITNLILMSSEIRRSAINVRIRRGAEVLRYQPIITLLLAPSATNDGVACRHLSPNGAPYSADTRLKLANNVTLLSNTLH
uniref:Cilia- and flagella-associated protein 206 n=1 Tax=Soboliphyme baturini TaxID=241478 RepID=A0A183JAS1_9BILA